MNVIAVRDSPDWSNLNEDNFFDQKFSYNNEDWHKMLNEIFEKIQIWNSNFTLSYFQYRQRLKEIASQNLSKTDAILSLALKTLI